MAIREIRLDSDPILRKKSRKVEKIDDRITELLKDMLDTMYEAEGVGLAAPQVGVLRRVVVVDIGDGPMQIINPEIIETDGVEEAVEGCLSVPGFSGLVERPKKLKLKYLDESSNEITIDVEDYLARAICHEIDHLDGVLYTDRAVEMYEITKEDEVEE